MKTLRSVVILWALLPLRALAVDAAAPPSAPSQYGSCPLAQPPEAEAAAAPPAAKPPAKQRGKINLDRLYDPCRIADAKHNVDEAPNDGLSPEQRLELYQDVMEWDRHEGKGAQPESWWRLGSSSGPGNGAGEGAPRTDWLPGWTVPPPAAAAADRQWPPESGTNLPAVPEPYSYPMWLAGLALLALAGRHRAQH